MNTAAGFQESLESDNPIIPPGTFVAKKRATNQDAESFTFTCGHPIIVGDRIYAMIHHDDKKYTIFSTSLVTRITLEENVYTIYTISGSIYKITPVPIINAPRQEEKMSIIRNLQSMVGRFLKNLFNRK